MISFVVTAHLSLVAHKGLRGIKAEKGRLTPARVWVDRALLPSFPIHSFVPVSLLSTLVPFLSLPSSAVFASFFLSFFLPSLSLGLP